MERFNIRFECRMFNLLPAAQGWAFGFENVAEAGCVAEISFESHPSDAVASFGLAATG